MALPLNKLVTKRKVLTGGHRLCPGCTAPLIVKYIAQGTDDPLVITNATGCLEVSTTIYPYSAWITPWFHNAFENAAATISGVETAYKALVERGRYPEKNVKFVAFGGDGGTYDIGLQSLSGALERGHQFLYVCYNNQAYMNTGYQRSSATPKGASTTTTPSGKESYGKKQFPKDLTMVVAAHGIPYAAQASPHNFQDLISKAQKAFSVKGPSFINVISSCVPGWGIPSDMTLEATKRAVESCLWPIYEIENGVLKINYKPKKKIPVIEFYKLQTRFKHLFKNPEYQKIIDEIQEKVDKDWERLLNLEGLKLF